MTAQDQYRIQGDTSKAQPGAEYIYGLNHEHAVTSLEMLLALPTAPRGLLPEMRARKIFSARDLDGMDNGADLRLVSVPFSIFQQEVELLKAHGFEQTESEGGDIHCGCSQCGFGRVAELKYCQITDGKPNLYIYRAFWLCPMCFYVGEQLLFGYEELTAEGVITAHTEGLLADDRIEAGSCDTSSVGGITPLSSGSSATTELYIDGGQ